MFIWLQIYATVRSGSLAIAASTLDSLLDLMAGGILWFTHLSMKNINIYKYPIGKLRVQPVGIIIFAAVMATLGTFCANLSPFYCSLTSVYWSISLVYLCRISSVDSGCRTTDPRQAIRENEFRAIDLVVCNYANSNRSKTCTVALLQKLWQQNRSCLCQGWLTCANIISSVSRLRIKFACSVCTWNLLWFM